jgi:CubicO group peptidase (beta-lactamase class C family)
MRYFLHASCLLFTLITACGSSKTTSLTLSSIPEVDSIMRNYDRPGGPGAAVLVVRDGQVLHSKGYGLANLEDQTPATEATSYRLASVSKQFIGMAIAILSEQQRLNYSQTLVDIFPDFPAYGRRVTIDHLLHHTSGLQDYEDLIPGNQTEQLSDFDVLRLYKQRTSSTRFTPGSQYRYCNGGYVLLGLVIEAASGQALDSFLHDHIFSPLGMRSVMYQGEATPIVNRAYGYSSRGSGWVRTDQSITSATRGDGGIYASNDDLFLWDQALYGTDLVSAETMKLIFTPGRLNGGGSSGYGFGWQIGSYRGEKRISHTGSTIGFRSVIHRYPGRHFTVTVIINREGATPWNLADQIADQVLF